MFRILKAGDWPPGRVRTVFEPNNRASIPEVESAIESAWTAAKARPGVLLFDGPMCRLQSWSADSDSLTLRLADSSYKPFFGTNISHPEFATIHGDRVMANPVGVSPAVRTSDGHLIFGRRNESVAYYPGRIHPFAGCLEPRDSDVFAAVIRELGEELSLQPENILDLRCTGIVQEMNLRQSELIFAAEVAATQAELSSRLHTAEHVTIWSVPATATDVATAIRNPNPLLTPVAVSSLLLWGRVRFGESWYRVLASGFVDTVSA